MKELAVDDYCIVIFTNQGGVEKGHTSIAELKKKFSLIQNTLKLPLLFLAATNDDKYRKPSTATWEFFLQKYINNHKIDLNLKDTFYCGDAAGRPKDGTRKKDFSDSDRKFAINIGLNFKVPEELFHG